MQASDHDRQRVKSEEPVADVLSLPLQAASHAHSGEQGALGVTAKIRALQLVRECHREAGITLDALLRKLGAEGHITYSRQTRDWLDAWVTKGLLQRSSGGYYAPADSTLHSPTLATSHAAPLLLRRAYQIVSATEDLELSSRELADALGGHVSVICGELCAQMKEVGVTRPDKGRISKRYRHGGGFQTGYTAETLGRAIAAYNAGAFTTAPPSAPA